MLHTQSKYPVYAYLLVASALAALISVCANPGIYEPYLEGQAYLQMAQGRPETAYNYYAGRMLHPFAARMLAAVAPMDLRRAFFVVAVISLFALCVFLSLYAFKLKLNPLLLIPLVSVPAVITLYQGYYFQDLFHAMLTAAFFVLYSYSAWAALPILLLLHLTRESTVLLSIWLVAMSLRRRSWALAFGVAAVAIIGMSATNAAVHAALPNKHGINMLEMYALKVPYAFCNNILGLVFWTDTNAATINCVPSRVFNVAGHLGSIRQVGFCGFQPQLIIATLAAFLAPFGVEPAILARLVRGRSRALLEHDNVFHTAFGYGATCLVLAPLVGTSPARYFLYAWPLYWLALPELLKGLAFHRSRTIVLLALHASAGALALCVPYEESWYASLSMVAVLLALNAVAYFCVSKMISAARQI